MKTRVVALSIVALALGVMACDQTLNPCPSGSQPVRSEQRCVVSDPASVIGQGDAGPGDGAIDATSDEHDAAQHSDAAPAEPDASGEDAAVDATRPENPECASPDVASWAAFHKQNGLVDSLLECAKQGCTTEACAAANCIRAKAGVETCDACTEREALCTQFSCFSACGEPGNDAECRACGCEAGCVARFETCAGSAVNVCSDVYGRAAHTNEPALERPVAFRLKGGTGVIGASPLAAYPDERLSTILTSVDKSPFHQHWSTGFTHLVSLEVDGRALLLQHKSQCGDDPCIARISPVLSDGSLGRPVYLDTWSAGWDKIEAFRAGAGSFLLRYKSGKAQTKDEPKGHLSIDRLTWNADQLMMERVLDRDDTRPHEAGWSSIEAFSHAGATHLLFHGLEREGQVRIDRVDVAESTLTLEVVSSATVWADGWDVVETFAVGDRWFALNYKSGSALIAGEAAGTVRVMSFTSGLDKQVFFTPVLHQSAWPTGITRVIGYRDESRGYLLRQDEKSGSVTLLRLADPTTFQTTLGESVLNATWGTSPAWNVVEVVRKQPW